MRAPLHALGLIAALLASACLPDFHDFGILRDAGPGDTGPADGDADADEPVEDTGPPDGGSDWNNPLVLGAPCDDPHLAVALTSSDSTSAGRLVRYNIQPGGEIDECHELPIAREQGAFGHGVTAITALPDGTQYLAVADAILALDDRGFPRWRWQPWESSGYDYADLFPLKVGGQWRVGVVHCDSPCYDNYLGLLVLDSDGEQVAHVDDLDSYATGLPSAAAHPDGGGQLVFESGFGPLRVFDITSSTTALDGETADVLGGGAGFNVPDVGNLDWLETDLETRTMIAVYTHAIVPWQAGQALPSSGMTCALCESYKAAAVDPLDDGAYFVICDTGSRDSLVHMRGGTCDLLVDGTTLTDHLLVDVAVIRASMD
jgi:hypothetical protein